MIRVIAFSLLILINIPALADSDNDYYLGLYPKGLTVSYGAKSDSNYYQFQYNFVNEDISKEATFQITMDVPSNLILKANTTENQDKRTSYIECLYANSTPAIQYIDPLQQPIDVTIPAQTGAICNVYIVLWANNNNDSDANAKTPKVTMTASGTGTSSGQNLTAETTVYFADGSSIDTRTITFKNNCEFPVFWGVSPSSIQAKNSSLVNCESNEDCFKGSTCVKTAKDSSQCFWDIPESVNSAQNQLNTGDKQNIEIPIYDNGIMLKLDNNVSPVWGAKLFGRTGCNEKRCLVNDCSSPLNAALLNTATQQPNDNKIKAPPCTQGGGFNALPISQAEVTFQVNSPILYSNMVDNDGVDTYNISMIDGITIPVSVKPLSGAVSITDPYRCTGPGLGSSQQKSPLGACSWQFNFDTGQGISDATYRWVTLSSSAQQQQQSQIGQPCTKDDDNLIKEGIYCGLSYNPKGSVIKRTYGYPIGYNPQTKTYSGPKTLYWTVNKVCAADSAYEDSSIGCTSPLAHGTLADLYACHKGYHLSCYDSTDPSCCGCSDWQDGYNVPKPTAENSCKTVNPEWKEDVLNQVSWAKKACPTSYVYPYDDKSSTFTCVNNKENTKNPANPMMNSVNYQVEFCPK